MFLIRRSANGKMDKEIEEDIAYFMNHGMSRKDAEDYCRQQNGIVRFLKRNQKRLSCNFVKLVVK